MATLEKFKEFMTALNACALRTKHLREQRENKMTDPEKILETAEREIQRILLQLEADGFKIFEVNVNLRNMITEIKLSEWPDRSC